MTTIFLCNLCLSVICTVALSLVLADLSVSPADAGKAERMLALERPIGFVVSRRLSPRGELGDF